MTPHVRVLIAEDHTIVRQGLRALLGAHAQLEVVGEAEDGREAVRLAEELRPDVVVMDLGMPGLNGVDATRFIIDAGHGARVIVLSMHGGEEYARPAIRAGARGYLVKGSGLEDLVRAIEAVMHGQAFFSPEVAALLLPAAEASSEGGGELTGREREVLQRVAEGSSSAEIASALGLSVKTVEGHRGKLMTKLGAKNVADLVRHAVRLGLVDVHRR
ncbi:MAG: response regulator [Polyangiales bacterium]